MVTYVGRTRTNLDCVFPLETVIVSCQNIKDTEGVVVVCRPFMFNCKLVKLAWQVFSCDFKKMGLLPSSRKDESGGPCFSVTF